MPLCSDSVKTVRGGGSGIFILDPHSWIPDLGSWIRDPTTAIKEQKFVVLHFFSHKYHKIDNYNIFNRCQFKKRIIVHFNQNNCHKALKIWVWDPNPISKIRDPVNWKNLFWIPDPWAKKASDPGSLIWIRSATLMPSVILVMMVALYIV